MKILKIISMIVIIVIAFTIGFNMKPNTQYNINKFKRLVNNNIDKEKIITRYISKNNMVVAIFGEVDMEFIWNNIEIECLRENNDYYYSIHKLNENEYVYIFYKKDKTNNEIALDGYIHLNKLLTKDDFKEIKIGESTDEDVFQIDKYAERYNLSGRGSMVSIHRVISGEILVIYYDFDHTVSEIDYKDSSDDERYNAILPQDK